MAYQYQNIWAEPVDIENGKISIRNEYFFRDLSNYKMEWSLVNDGKVVKSGEVDELNIAPQATDTITLPYNIAESDSDAFDTFLNIAFKLKSAEPLMAAGQTVATRQMEVETSLTAIAIDPEACSEDAALKLKIQNKKKDPQIVITSDSMTVAFDKTSGLLTQWVYDGKSLLGEGGTLRPNFWRAVTDNDMGADLQKKLAVWRSPKMTLTSLTAEKMENYKDCAAEVKAVYDMPEVKATLTMTYNVRSDGSIFIGEEIEPKEETENLDVPDMLRYGVVIDLPYNMDKSEYYGRGPIENYSDRTGGQWIGIYKQTADEQFYPYIRPQETGTKCDMRWWRQTDGNGFGFEVIPDAVYFDASALHYNISDLDEGNEKHQRHPQDVPKSKFTELTLDLVQQGVGGTDSWGELPLEKYRVHFGEKSFWFDLEPINKYKQL